MYVCQQDLLVWLSYQSQQTENSIQFHLFLQVCICLSFSRISEKFQAIFMKPCSSIMDYCYKKEHFNFGVGHPQNGQLAAILDVGSNTLHTNHVQSFHK